ncbi:DUF4159 domain-containing protein [Candidatus Latescibacterota bacterium]
MKKFYISTSVVTALALIMIVFSPFISNGQGGVKAQIYLDASNKKNISGYTYICHAYNQRMSRTMDVKRGLINLKEAMLKWTNIDTRLDKPLPISSPNIMKMPFIYLPFEAGLELTTPEKTNIRNYLNSGGFMVIENINKNQEVNLSESTFRKVFAGIFQSGVKFAPIQNNHPLYSCFFTFPDGPPRGDETNMVDINSLEGMFIEGRLAAIFSKKRYVVKWNSSLDNEPQLRMGVNMLVYSLIQKGGIAQVD